MRPRVIASTTSHKTEPFLPTLEVLSRLGLCDLDLNLWHVIEEGVSVGTIQQGLVSHGQRVWVVSGGWCDFSHGEPEIDRTFSSVERQVAIARQLGVGVLRLFFGRLKRADYNPASRDIMCGNLRRLSDRHPDVTLVLENHDGASARPEVCREILERVDRLNVRLTFDPINFERAGVNSLEALETLRPWIGHVHLKGIERGELCEFGAGDVDLTPLLRSLLGHGYTGGFSVEYEGPFDGTLRLYHSVRRAEATVKEIAETYPPVR